eukprot:TRINITY_DN1549_c0_g1_i1.p1 TRINITY_DN1549_c0_g1~~TRINITY_DN1549_c0_g1_i1.p1  ORF type:complete len:205 (+),score=53.06 TRINITY_DN1549_c0_g1_i1:73-687(+)
MAAMNEESLSGAPFGDGFNVVMNPLTDAEFEAAFSSLRQKSSEDLHSSQGGASSPRSKQVVFEALNEVIKDPNLKGDTKDVAKDFEVFKAVFFCAPMQKLIRREMQDEGFAPDTEETETKEKPKEKELFQWILDTLMGAAQFIFDLICEILDLLFGDIMGFKSKKKVRKITNAVVVAVSTIIRAILSRIAVLKYQKGAYRVAFL